MDILPAITILSANDRLMTCIKLDGFKLFTEARESSTEFMTYFPELRLFGLNPSCVEDGPKWKDVLSVDGVPYVATRTSDLSNSTASGKQDTYWIIGPAHGKIMAACRYAASRITDWNFASFCDFARMAQETQACPTNLVPFLDEELSKTSRELAETKVLLATAQENQLVALEDLAKYKCDHPIPKTKITKSYVGVIAGPTTITMVYSNSREIIEKHVGLGSILFDLRSIKCSWNAFWTEMWKCGAQTPQYSVLGDNTCIWSKRRFNDDDLSSILWKVANADARTK